MRAHVFKTQRAAEALAAWIVERRGAGAARALKLLSNRGYIVQATHHPMSACDVQDCRDAGFEFPPYALAKEV